MATTNIEHATWTRTPEGINVHFRGHLYPFGPYSDSDADKVARAVEQKPEDFVWGHLKPEDFVWGEP